MNQRSLIAIKKRRETTQIQPLNPPFIDLKDDQPLVTKPKIRVTLTENDLKANKYLRENFAIWQYNRENGCFADSGVQIWEFLHKFMNKWNNEQREDYITSLSLIQEATNEFTKKAFHWYTYQKFHPEDKLKYLPCTFYCQADIFEIIADLKGNVTTSFTSPDWPLNDIFCQYGYIVDFDESELHVLYLNDMIEPLKVCPLLRPIEEIYGKQGTLLARIFKFDELPETREKFLDIMNEICERVSLNYREMKIKKL